MTPPEPRSIRDSVARWLAECAQDVGIALRQFRQAPAFVPMRRALRIDPMKALRAE